MAIIRYEALGEDCSFSVRPLTTVAAEAARSAARPRRAGRATAPAAAAPESFDAQSLASTVRKMSHLGSTDVAQLGVVETSSAGPRRGPRRAGGASVSRATGPTMTIMTPMVIVEGAHRSAIQAAIKSGAKVLDEGLDGKLLLTAHQLADVPKLITLLKAHEVASVSPHFLRRIKHTARSIDTRLWANEKIGIAEAWKITKGSPGVSVAVLDEGVDTRHPALKAAVVGERDFIGGNGNSAMPDGNDAHGTACAGTIVSRSKRSPGIAPKCTLLAARIAMDNGQGDWIFDDYATADAIDWAWREGASVLSNSWGGGAPSDAIIRAFGRARTQGRGGLGAVVCMAAGNDELELDFPGSLPGFVTVGASNPRDERKTFHSSDGEEWGSNYGKQLWILAPGVFIRTTDISGPRGYENDNFTSTFNGTSAATPHVAAAAALILSRNPELSAAQVRRILAKTAKKLKGQTDWTEEFGFGRLDVGKAVASA